MQYINGKFIVHHDCVMGIKIKSLFNKNCDSRVLSLK